MRVLICDDIFPAMMEVLHGLLSKTRCVPAARKRWKKRPHGRKF